MKMVCANCDLGLKRSDCSERDYIRCECRRWIVEEFKREKTAFEFIQGVFDEACTVLSEECFCDVKDRMVKEMIAALSKELLK